LTLQYLLDTDICVHALKKRNRPLLVKLQANEDVVAVSSVTLFELAFGAEMYAVPQSRYDQISDFIIHFEILDFDRVAAVQSGKIRHELQKRGTPIGSFDYQIAGIAKSRGLTVVTGNSREFARVDGLALENWL
jgi:tRNA(fMet)-specific endonuclease VapC